MLTTGDIFGGDHNDPPHISAILRDAVDKILPDESKSDKTIPERRRLTPEECFEQNPAEASAIVAQSGPAAAPQTWIHPLYRQSEEETLRIRKQDRAAMQADLASGRADLRTNGPLVARTKEHRRHAR